MLACAEHATRRIGPDGFVWQRGAFFDPLGRKIGFVWKFHFFAAALPCPFAWLVRPFDVRGRMRTRESARLKVITSHPIAECGAGGDREDFSREPSAVSRQPSAIVVLSAPKERGHPPVLCEPTGKLALAHATRRNSIADCRLRIGDWGKGAKGRRDGGTEGRRDLPRRGREGAGMRRPDDSPRDSDLHSVPRPSETMKAGSP